MASFNSFAIDPNRETAAKPTKNPSVAPTKALTGLPRTVRDGVDISIALFFECDPPTDADIALKSTDKRSDIHISNRWGEQL